MSLPANKVFIGLVVVLIFLFEAKSVFAGDIVINEIMYDLSGSDTKSDTNREWIEIYNKGTSSTDLTNWRFKEGGTNHTLNQYQGSINLDPGGFAVIVDNPATFLNDNSGFSGTIIDSSFSLSNTGEILTILQDDLITVSDEVTYQSSWGGAGTGGSLERKSASGTSNDSSNWQEGAIGGTPGTNNSSGLTPTPTPSPSPSQTPTSMPTNTPTPTPKPASTPTKTPIPTKTSAPTKTPIPTKTEAYSSLKNTPTPTASTNTTKKEPVPSLVLGENEGKENKNKDRTVLETNKEELSEENKTEGSILSKIFLFIGSIFLTSSGIMLARSYIRHRRQNGISF